MMTVEKVLLLAAAAETLVGTLTHAHWDHTGHSGGGCVPCIDQRTAAALVRQYIADVRKDLGLTE